MISMIPSKGSELVLDNGGFQTSNIDEDKDNLTSVFANGLEVERERIATQKLEEKLSQAELIIEQHENMIKATTVHLKDLVSKYRKSEKDYSAMLEERRVQDEYESKEIDFLKSELSTLKRALQIQNEKLEKAKSKNSNLKNAITANRFEIFKASFNGLDEKKIQHSDSNCTSLNATSEETETSLESTGIESTDLSD